MIYDFMVYDFGLFYFLGFAVNGVICCLVLLICFGQFCMDNFAWILVLFICFAQFCMFWFNGPGVDRSMVIIWSLNFLASPLTF